MAYIDTLLWNGHDVRTLPGVVAVDVIDGLYAPMTRRGDDDTIPGRQGQIGAALPLDKYLITVPLTVTGSTTATLNANLATIGGYLNASNGLGTLTRHLDNGSGFDAHTARGRFATILGFTLVNHETAQASLQFYNLSGAWWNGSAWLVP